MGKKCVVGVIAVLIAIGFVIGIYIIKKDKKEEQVVLIDNDKIGYIEIQHKDELFKTESHEKIEKIANLFEKEMKMDTSLENKKGWIYKVSIFHESDKSLSTIFVLDESSIIVNGKGYRYDGRFVSLVEEISLIKR